MIRARRRSPFGMVVAAFAASLGASNLSPAEASAYCRTAGCDGRIGARCEPAQATDCGTPVTWESRCFGYSLQRDGTRRIPFGVVRETVARSFAAWENASCGGGARPGLRIVELDTIACDRQEYNREGANANAVIFHDEGWPYGRGVLALTTVTFRTDTGAIRDADLEVNSEHIAFTASDDDVEYDLQSVLTHEAGHVLGLAHTNVTGATMVEAYRRGTIGLRDLSADDQAGICAVFPPAEVDDGCDPTPRGGLGDRCGGAASSTGEACTCAAAGAPSGREGLGLLALAVGLALASRRRLRAAGLRAEAPPS